MHYGQLENSEYPKPKQSRNYFRQSFENRSRVPMKHWGCHLDYEQPHVMLLSLNTIGVSQLLLDEMEQWNERTQLLEAKLDEVRKKPGNSLTGNVKLALNTCINKPCKKANLDFFFLEKTYGTVIPTVH